MSPSPKCDYIDLLLSTNPMKRPKATMCFWVNWYILSLRCEQHVNVNIYSLMTTEQIHQLINSFSVSAVNY